MSDHATNLNLAAKAENKLAKLTARELASIVKVSNKAVAANAKNKQKIHAARVEFLTSLSPEVLALLDKTSDG